jgi:hypothetical protein
MEWSMGEGFNQLFVDSSMMNRARYPNTGSDLLIPTRAFGNAQASTISGASSRADDYWAGGTVSGTFGHKWYSQTAKITGSSGGTLTLGDKTAPWETGNGQFYITGIFEELDSAGEWFYVPEEQKMYFWAENDADPNTLSVSAKARQWCANLSDREHIILDGLNMLGGSVRMDTDNAQVLNSHMKYISHFTFHTWSSFQSSGGKAEGHNGIWIDGDNNLIQGCTIEYSAGSGVIIHGANNLITRNIIRHMDYSATYSCPLAIVNSLGNNQVLFNSIYNTARDVVQLYGANNDRIMYNDLYHAGRLCNDLGITYQWGRDGNGTRIAYNWIHDNLAQTGPGVYHDNYCSNFITDYNVIWNCQSGVRHNGPTTGSKTYNNTLFNCLDVGSRTYNQWPDYTPAYWTANYNRNIYEFDGRNNLFLGNDPDSQLSDAANYDFTLKDQAAAIDSASIIASYTDIYTGSAPDRGAYEKNGEHWTAGHTGSVTPQASPVLSELKVDDYGIETISVSTAIPYVGSSDLDVTLYWGTQDGGNISNNWQFSKPLTSISASDSTPISINYQLGDLTPETTYYLAIRVANDESEFWSATQNATPIFLFNEQQRALPVSIDLAVTSNDSKNTSNTSLIAGNPSSSSGADSRVFIRFDLSAISPLWEISAAELRLYHTEGSNDTYGASSLYQVTSDWDANSLAYTQSVASIGSLTGSQGPFNTFIDTDVTSIIKNYQSDPSSHYGFSIRGSEGFTVTGKYFNSSENAQFSPQLVITYSIPDSDADGLPDSWEWENFQSISNADATSDSDNDSSLDIEEHTAGTSPTDPSSRLSVVASSLTETDGSPVFDLTWSSVTGKTYRIEKSQTLLSDWVPVDSQLLANPPLNTYSIPLDANDPIYFYRVVVEE